jgi:hypothetical protein
MLKMLFLLASSFILQCNAHAFEPWSTRDITLELAYVSVAIIDWAQTRDIASERRPGIYETNLILGRHPDKQTVNKYFLLTTLGHVALAGALNNPYRNWLQYAGIGVELYCIRKNIALGIRMDFK